MPTPIYLSEAEHRLVSEAVSAAEAHTAGEIVTVVADRSDGYTDVALGWAALASFTALALFTAFPEFFLGWIDWIFGLWGHHWTQREILSVALGLAVLKLLGVMAIQMIPQVKFLLIPGWIKTARVHDRAMALFKVGAQHKTDGRTGVLIYLSMREHRAEILADQAIAEKVSAETWGEAMADMLEHIREKRIAEGIVAGVRDVGVVLTEHFPATEENQNELPDRLIEI